MIKPKPVRQTQTLIGADARRFYLGIKEAKSSEIKEEYIERVREGYKRAFERNKLLDPPTNFSD